MSTLPVPTIDYTRLTSKLGSAKNDEELYSLIVNSPFEYTVDMATMFLGIIVFLLYNPEEQTVDRIALSDTNAAKEAQYVSVKEFHDIKIPYSDRSNIIVKAIKSKQPQYTDDWMNLFTPALSPEQARLNQASSGIGYSSIYPVGTDDKKGALIFSYYQYPEKLGELQKKFMQKYALLVTDQLNKS